MFRDRTRFYLEEDFSLISTSEPIMGSPAAITSIFNLPPLDTDRLEEYEDQNRLRFNILKLIRRRQNSKTVLRAQKHYTVRDVKKTIIPK